MRTVLQAKGYSVHYAEYGGGHDWICWQGTLADGLMTLLGADRTEEIE
jgi:enterochelin esterase-like enzyme